MEIGLLVSGNLGVKVFSGLLNNTKINFVLTDKGSTHIISLCHEHNIICFAGNPRNGKVLSMYPNLSCDILLSVNYLFLIEKDIIELPKRIAINFHGSLLPKYRVRTPHVWAIINNEKETGITAHVIDDDCDTGAVIEQRKIAIGCDDTGATILENFNNIYPSFVNDVLKNIESGNFSVTEQDNSLATYFGKRTAEDGLIDWNWQKERINNWVRAQAKPYPGAFTYYNTEKIIIHKIEFSEFGFNFDTPNGQIVAIEDSKPIIKTPNGCVKLVEYEFNNKIEIFKILK